MFNMNADSRAGSAFKSMFVLVCSACGSTETISSGTKKLRTDDHHLEDDGWTRQDRHIAESHVQSTGRGLDIAFKSSAWPMTSLEGFCSTPDPACSPE